MQDKTPKDIQQHKLGKKIKNYIYDPSETIGKGFSSSVFKGINELNSSVVAIKVIQLAKIKNQVQTYLFHNEINALKNLSHPNVLKTFDVLQTKNNAYFVTEFCEEGDLQKIIKAKGKIPDLQALQITKQIVEGYKAVQQKNIVHRDLKSANIFMSNGHPRIADFGFCQFVGGKKPNMLYNVGSPVYMSPQAYKDNHYTHKSDLWGVGIILYEMLVGIPPGKNQTYDQMVRHLIADPLVEIQNEELRGVLKRIFKQNLNQRIQCNQLQAILEQILQRYRDSRQMRRPGGMESPPALDKFVENKHEAFKSQQLQRKGPQKSSAVFQSLINDRKNILSSQNIPDSPMRQNSDFKLKHHIELLLFLWRMLKLIGKSNSEKLGCSKVILFRHRNYLDKMVQRISIQENINKNTFEPYKQFQYLKSMFDESYLQYQSVQRPSGQTDLLVRNMNSLANYGFTDRQAIPVHAKILIQLCQQCRIRSDNLMDQNEKDDMGALFDYFMLEIQVLKLYKKGLSTDQIGLNYIPFSKIMKEKHKKLSGAHWELLRIKLSYLKLEVQNL